MGDNANSHRIRRLALAGIGVLALAALAPLSALAQSPSPLKPASSIASEVSTLFWIVMGIAVVVFVIVEGLLLYAVLRYRRRYPDDIPEQIHGNARLEIMWTVVPALIMVVLFGLTLRTLQIERNAPPDSLVIEVTGRQWFWEFRYPETGITTNSRTHDLVIPAGEPIIFEVKSADVIHSFWVPQLAGKMDAIPGYTNTLWFEAQPGVYVGQCAEYCGLSHYNMLFDVHAVSRAEFDTWMDEQIVLASQFRPIGTDLETPLPIGDPVRGDILFNQELGCQACHSLDGTQLVGPTIRGLGAAAASRVSGMTAEEYLRESILLPCDYVVSGFTCVMPQNYGERLDAQGLSDLIAYLLEQ